MRIVVDADSCFVKEEIIAVAERYGIDCLFIWDDSHRGSYPGASVITVAIGQNSADYEIIEEHQKGDIVVTSDIGLAWEIYDKGSIAVNFIGQRFHPDYSDPSFIRMRACSLYHRLNYTRYNVYSKYNRRNPKLPIETHKADFAQSFDIIVHREWIAYHQKIEAERRKQEALERAMLEQRAQEAREAAIENAYVMQEEASCIEIDPELRRLKKILEKQERREARWLLAEQQRNEGLSYAANAVDRYLRPKERKGNQPKKPRRYLNVPKIIAAMTADTFER